MIWINHFSPRVLGLLLLGFHYRLSAFHPTLSEGMTEAFKKAYHPLSGFRVCIEERWACNAFNTEPLNAHLTHFWISLWPWDIFSLGNSFFQPLRSWADIMCRLVYDCPLSSWDRANFPLSSQYRDVFWMWHENNDDSTLVFFLLLSSAYPKPRIFQYCVICQWANAK